MNDHARVEDTAIRGELAASSQVREDGPPPNPAVSIFNIIKSSLKKIQEPTHSPGGRWILTLANLDVGSPVCPPPGIGCAIAHLQTIVTVGRSGMGGVGSGPVFLAGSRGKMRLEGRIPFPKQRQLDLPLRHEVGIGICSNLDRTRSSENCFGPGNHRGRGGMA